MASERSKQNYAGLCLILGVFIMSLLYPNVKNELDINTKWLAPANSTCTVTGNYVDVWLSCGYRATYCENTCWGYPSCLSLMSAYDGNRDKHLNAKPNEVAQSCCQGSCCMHESCDTTCWDDHDDGGIGSWSDDGRRRILSDGISSTWRSLTGTDDLEDYSQSGEDQLLNLTNASLLTGCSTTCSCDYWGDQENQFYCENAYDGVVMSKFKHPKTGEPKTSVSYASHQTGDCKHKQTKDCAQDYVDAHPVDSVADCWFDPDGDEVVYERGWSTWLWTAVVLNVLCIVFCCNVCLRCMCPSTAGSSSASTGWSNPMSPLSSQASEQMPLNREFKPDAYGGGWEESEENSVEMTGVPKPEHHRMGSGEYIDWAEFDQARHIGKSNPNVKHPPLPKPGTDNSNKFVPDAFGGSWREEDATTVPWMPNNRKIVVLPPGKVGIFFTRDNGGQRVSDMRPHCPVMDELFIGDVVTAVEDLDVTNCEPDILTSFLKRNIRRERRLFVRPAQSVLPGDITVCVPEDHPILLLSISLLCFACSWGPSGARSCSSSNLHRHRHSGRSSNSSSRGGHGHTGQRSVSMASRRAWSQRC